MKRRTEVPVLAISVLGIFLNAVSVCAQPPAERDGAVVSASTTAAPELLHVLASSAPAFSGVRSAARLGPAITLQWGAGIVPFAVQKKFSVSDSTWITLLTTPEHRALVAIDGTAGIFRVIQNAPAAVLPFTVFLSGAAERPTPVNTAGTGIGSLSLDGDKLTFHMSYSGLSGPATAAHIHGPATAAEATGVLISLAPFNGGAFGTSGTLSGTVLLTAEQKAHLLAGKTYVNIHTGANPGGEIRGQVARSQLAVTLSGGAERPNPVTTSGRGGGTLTLIGNQLTFNVVYAGLSGAAAAAHIHGPGSVEQAVGVMISLAPFNGGSFGASGTLEGTVTLAPDQLAALVDGQTYVNIHTAANAGGEIRGQIAPMETFSAVLNGAAERPDPVTTMGTGNGTLSLVGNQLTFNIAYSGLGGPATAAHIHGPGTVDQAVGVMISLAPFNGGSFGTAGSLAGTVTLTADQTAALLAGQTYVNIHTAANPGGEIRGQIGRPQKMATILTGAAERPNPVVTTGSGIGTLTLVANQLSFDISYTGLSGVAQAAHIHGPGTVDQAVGVMISLAPFNGGSFGTSGKLAGTVTLTSEQLNHVLNEMTYVNIHTPANPGGEIRGQITSKQLPITLSGAAERPNPVSTSGSGTGLLTLSGNLLSFSINYSGLSGPATAAHVHGPATVDQAAGVLVSLAPFNGGSFGSSGTLIGALTLTPEQLVLGATGQTYVNIHTAANPGGEIRGQIIP